MGSDKAPPAGKEEFRTGRAGPLSNWGKEVLVGGNELGILKAEEGAREEFAMLLIDR